MKLANELTGEFGFLEFRDNVEVPGVFISEPYVDMLPSGARGIEAGRLLAWNPAVDLENGPDPATWPVLPATFSARDLAAFLVYGVGTFIHDFLGTDGVLDESALKNVGGMRDEWARQALREAYELAGRARAVVGPLDDEAERAAVLLGRQLDDATDQANERERVFEPGISGDEASARRDRAKAAVACLEKEFDGLKAKAEQKRERWRRDMVRALFEVEDVRQGEAVQKKKPGRKLSVAPALLAEILNALESYAATTGQDFDRHAMPGPLGKSADDEGGFHWLCARLYPRVFNRAPATFTGYRAGLCALAPYPKPTDFYRLALPRIAPKLGVTLDVRHMPKKGREVA